MPSGAMPRVLAALIAVVVLVGVAALVVRSGDDDSGTTIEAGGSGESDGESERLGSSESTTSTTAAPTTVAPVPTTAVPTTAAPATTPTTAPRPPTTAASRRPSFELAPTSGPAGTRVTASGGGCQGENYGVGIHIHDPSGQAVDGDGSSTQPDGSWRLEFSIGHYQAGPGDYTIRPVCMNGASAVVFEYAPRTFTVT